MNEQTYLNNQFLIAMPSLEDPFFSQTVTYICEHNEHGAVGIIINRPLGINLDQVLEQMSISSADGQVANSPVMLGGPVQQDRGFVIHKVCDKWRSTINTSNEVAVTTSRDILESIANNEGPLKTLISLGYAGWAPGQLEDEIINNSWLHCPYDESIIFDTPFDERWFHATKSLGINPEFLMSDAGHA